MHTINKIIIKKSVKFYSETWRYRNEVKHDLSKHKEFVKDWCEKVIEIVRVDNRPELLKCIGMQEINVDQCDAAHVLVWIKSMLEF